MRKKNGRFLRIEEMASGTVAVFESTDDPTAKKKGMLEEDLRKLIIHQSKFPDMDTSELEKGLEALRAHNASRQTP